MTLSIVNGITFSDLNNELGYDSNSQINLNNATVRRLLANTISDVSMNTANGRALTTSVGLMFPADPLNTGTSRYHLRVYDAVIDTTTNIMYLHVQADKYTPSPETIYSYIVAINSDMTSVLWAKKLDDGSTVGSAGPAYVDTYNNWRITLSGSYVYVASNRNKNGNAYPNSGPMCILAKLNKSDGSLVWNYGVVGGDGYISDVYVNSLKVDPSGNNVFISGRHKHNLDNVSETNQMTGYVASINANGTIQWSHRFGSTSNTGTTHLPWCSLPYSAVDSGSNVYVGGSTTALTITPNVAPSYDYGIVVKYNSAGTLQWTKTFRNSTSLTLGNSYRVSDLCVDSSNNVYIMHIGDNNSNTSAVITSWTPAGTQRWISPEIGIDPASIGLGAGNNTYMLYNYSNNNMKIGPDGNLWFSCKFYDSVNPYDAVIVNCINPSTGAFINARKFGNNKQIQEYSPGGSASLLFDKDNKLRVVAGGWGGARGYAGLFFRVDTAAPNTLVGPDKANVAITYFSGDAVKNYTYANVEIKVFTQQITTTTNAVDGTMADPTYITLVDPFFNTTGAWSTATMGYISTSRT